MKLGIVRRSGEPCHDPIVKILRKPEIGFKILLSSNNNPISKFQLKKNAGHDMVLQFS